MKIQSKAVFYADETLSDGIVIFTGDGAVYGDEDGVVVSKVIDFTDITNISTGQDADENFQMILELTNKKVEINLAKITNQPTWENDADGLQVAIHDILSWKKKSSVEINLPDPATADVGQVLGVVDDAFAFVDPPSPSSSNLALVFPTEHLGYSGITVDSVQGISEAVVGRLICLNGLIVPNLEPMTTPIYGIIVKVTPLDETTVTSTILLMGYFRDENYFWSYLPLYYDNTTQGLTETIPTGSGEIVQQLGVSMTDVIYFNPDLTTITLS